MNPGAKYDKDATIARLRSRLDEMNRRLAAAIARAPLPEEVAGLERELAEARAELATARELRPAAARWQTKAETAEAALTAKTAEAERYKTTVEPIVEATRAVLDDATLPMGSERARVGDKLLQALADALAGTQPGPDWREIAEGLFRVIWSNNNSEVTRHDTVQGYHKFGGDCPVCHALAAYDRAVKGEA